MNNKAILEAILTTDQLKKVEEYIDQLLIYNQRFNLVSRRSSRDDIYRYFLDSFGLTEFLSRDKTETIVDIGSGAGFPGLPLAILGYNCNLVEINGKKAGFLNEIVKILGLSANAHHKDAKLLRSSDLYANIQQPEKATQSLSQINLVVVAKAVASCKNIIDMCRGLIPDINLLNEKTAKTQIDDRKLGKMLGVEGEYEGMLPNAHDRSMSPNKRRNQSSNEPEYSTTFLLLKSPSYAPEIDELKNKWSFKLQEYQNRYTPGSLIIEIKNLKKINKYL